MEQFEFYKKQDSRAIQYMSEDVNDTVLKYIKSVIICFGWGAPTPPRLGAPPQTPCFPQTRKWVEYFKNTQFCKANFLVKES